LAEDDLEYSPVDARARFLLFATGITLTLCLSTRTRAGSDSKVFWALPVRERPKAIRTYDLGEQLDLYLQGMRREPPDYGLADAVAGNGHEIIAPALQRLEREHSDLDRVSLIYLLSRAGTCYEVRKDATSLTAVRNAVASMKTPAGREEGEESLKDIESCR
jgi:hypothetical protein